MSKLLLTTAILLLTASCSNKPYLGQTVQEEPDYSGEDAYYPEDTEYSEWAGPGWYWGIYINNENDYWNHHNNHYNNNNNHNHNGNNGNHNHGGGHGGGGKHR